MSRKTLTIELPEYVVERFEAMSRKNGFNTDKLIELILRKFVDWDGDVYSGDWREDGSEMGRKVVIEWPHYPSTVLKPDRIIRVKNEELR